MGTQQFSCSKQGEITFDMFAGMLVMTSEGDTTEHCGDSLGQYSLHTRSPVVYKQEHSMGGGERYLYRTNKGWYVNHTIGEEAGALYNPDTSHTVPTTGWMYSKKGTM